MPSDELTDFMAAGLAFRTTHLGQTIRVGGVEKSAVFTAPRLEAKLGDSTVRVSRYYATVRILKTEVATIVTAAQWIDDGVVIELPEGAGWRTYRLVMEPTDGVMSGEWRMEVETV